MYIESKKREVHASLKIVVVVAGEGALNEVLHTGV